MWDILFVAYNLRRLMNIIDKNTFQKFLKELVMLFFTKTALLKAIKSIKSPLKFINQFLVPKYKLVNKSHKLIYI